MTHPRPGPRLRVVAAAALLALTGSSGAGPFPSTAIVEATPAPTAIPETPSVWVAQGQFRLEDFGSRVDGAGDVNGDGFGDVIIGAPGWGPDFSDRGRAVVYVGSPAGLSATPDWSLEGTRDLAALGISVAGAGDVNGDGYGDVIVGEPGFSGGSRPYRGRAWILPGSRQGLRTQQAWTIAGDAASEQLGESVAGAGDVNGDGLDDVLICSETRTIVVLGRTGGIDGRDPAWVGPPSWRPVGAGDVNRDGYDDVVLPSGGQTLLYLGSPSGLGDAPVWRGPSALSAAGGGDVNGDGYSDLVLSSGFAVPGEAWVYLGTPQGFPLASSWTIRDPSFPRYGFGLSLSIHGDVNRDGYDDILVSDETYYFGPSVFCYLGRGSGQPSAPDWAGREGLSPNIELSVALCGDVNGDGDSEVLAADPSGYTLGGSVRLFHLGRGFPGPRLEHELVNLGTEGAPLVLEATVVDHTDYVSRVEIVHRSAFDEGYREPIVMDRVEGDFYRGTIPGQLVRGGLLYFIRAIDNYGIVMQTIPIDVDLIPASAAAKPSALSFRVRLGAGPWGNPDRILFSTTRAGPARVRLYDVQGRLVGSLLDAAGLAAGSHVVPLSGAGLRHASGIYFYRVDTIDGSRSGRLLLTR